jgi:hypothetical protein
VSFREASALLDTIALDLGDQAVELRAIGDGTQFAVIIHKQFWCWQDSDWSKYKVQVYYPKQRQKMKMFA